MSINKSGLEAKLSGRNIIVEVDSKESLLKLGNGLEWKAIADIGMKDLIKTAKGMWWVGRSLKLRIHLGVYILQAMFNRTDRQIEQDVRHNALYQIFCGKGIVDSWHVPDATKIEEFRSRLSPTTQHAIGEMVLKLAKTEKFTNAKWMDIDSTVQEANISYPSDANMMVKLAEKGAALTEKFKGFGRKLYVDLKKIKGKAKEYFFLAKNTARDKKREVFAELHALIKKELKPVIKAASGVSQKKRERLSLCIQNLFYQICELCPKYLADVGVFIKTHAMVPTKILSLHAKAVVCVSKGKLGKAHEFGRVFQLARLPGNFLLIAQANSLHESDKHAVPKVLYGHRRIFGVKKINSVGADKGYSSRANVIALKRASVKHIGLQLPSNNKNIHTGINEKTFEKLKDRRAGIEPLIGHLKHGGFRKSRMKSDIATEAAAYRSTAGFNLRQIVRHIDGCFA